MSFYPVTPVFAIVTSGQAQIPTTAAEWSIHAISGGFWVNGQGPFDAPTRVSSVNGTTTVLNVGVTGGKTALFYANRPTPGG